MGTGIGKDGYSIIGQGRIDEILSNNSLERRNVFEEAAGISKYKARKTEAEKNLESTHQNLLRITDILSELEGQIGPLENQSEKAQKYLTLREELKTLEINNFINSTKNLEENIELIESHLKELHEELDIKLENSNNTYLKKENFG
jgi:chromosome segregation protein